MCRMASDVSPAQIDPALYLYALPVDTLMYSSAPSILLAVCDVLETRQGHVAV